MKMCPGGTVAHTAHLKLQEARVWSYMYTNQLHAVISASAHAHGIHSARNNYIVYWRHAVGELTWLCSQLNPIWPLPHWTAGILLHSYVLPVPSRAVVCSCPRPHGCVCVRAYMWLCDCVCVCVCNQSMAVWVSTQGEWVCPFFRQSQVAIRSRNSVTVRWSICGTLKTTSSC